MVRFSDGLINLKGLVELRFGNTRASVRENITPVFVIGFITEER